MSDFGIFRGFNEKLFGDKLVAGQLPTQLGLIGSEEVSDYIPILDTYTGAAAAYSLRYLRSGYTGSAIEVRIDTTGQPTYNIGFVNNELDTATLEGYCTGGLDAYVTKWYDQSGNGYDATQTTASAQPQIVSSGSVIEENGKPAVQFDGTSTKLFVVSSTNVFNFLHDGTISSVIGVARLLQTSSDNAFAPLIANTGGSSSNIGYQLAIENRSSQGSPNSLRTTVFASVSGQENTDNNTTTSGQSQNLYIDIVDTDASVVNLRSSHYINGGGVSRNNTSTVAPSTSNSTYDLHIGSFSNLGSGFIANGGIQEVILYPSDQSSNRSGIETNINDFYTIY